MSPTQTVYHWGFLPYRILNGVSLVDICGDVLYENSAQCSHLDQDLGCPPQSTLDMSPLFCSQSLFVHPSGDDKTCFSSKWYPRFEVTPSRMCLKIFDLYLRQSNQETREVLPPPSQTGLPQTSQWISVFKAKKCAYFKNLSTTTRMVFSLFDNSKPSTKSNEMSSQTLTGTNYGCKSPAGSCCDILCLWQTSQCYTCTDTSFLIPTQNQSAAILKYVFTFPEWPPIGELWYTCKMMGINDEFRGMTKRPLYSNWPSFNVKCVYSLAPDNKSLRIWISKGSELTSLSSFDQSTSATVNNDPNSMLPSFFLDSAYATRFELPELYLKWIPQQLCNPFMIIYSNLPLLHNES